MLYEVSEKIKDLGLNSDRFGAAPQLAAISVEDIPVKRELHRLQETLTCSLKEKISES
jgi:hypothetical protein